MAGTGLLGCHWTTWRWLLRAPCWKWAGDRLFPSQDVLPSGGVGNLIAALLYGNARRNGATVFLDWANLEPHEDPVGVPVYVGADDLAPFRPGDTTRHAIMSLTLDHPHIKHVTTEMTLRYASLAAPAVRTAYDEAMGKARARLTVAIAPAGQPVIPDRIRWLNSEMLKTRVAHGYCSRQLAAEACQYANICEQCDNFATAPEFIPALQAQLTDATALRDDAAERGWHTEVARHSRVIASIQKHLDRLARHARTGPGA